MKACPRGNGDASSAHGIIAEETPYTQGQPNRIAGQWDVGWTSLVATVDMSRWQATTRTEGTLLLRQGFEHDRIPIYLDGIKVEAVGIRQQDMLKHRKASKKE